ncbi:MAG: DUF4410 domain-containing protein [Candidatus Binatia bacterium]
MVRFAIMRHGDDEARQYLPSPEIGASLGALAGNPQHCGKPCRVPRRLAYRPRMIERFRSSVLVGFLGAFAGCAPTSISPSMMSAPPSSLGKPARIAVYDFVVEANDVSPNNAPLSRLVRLVGSSQTTEQVNVGRSVANTLAVELVASLKDLGLPVERASSGQVADGTLAIEGQFVTIDEGNRLRRVAIGFGAGASDVQTHVQLYLGTPTGPRLVDEFESDAGSSRKPGAAVTMGASSVVGAGVAAAGAAQGGMQAVTEPKDTAEADAKRTAMELATRVKKIFADRGWSSAPVP